MQEATTVAVKRELRLTHPIDGETWFSVGQNCEAIERIDGGYEIHRGSSVIRIEPHRVDSFVQDPRPGFAQQQRDAASDVPGFATKNADGTWTCSCGAVKRSLHALKIHHGKAHGGER